LLVSAIEPVKFIVFPMSFPEPHPIRAIFMVIPGVFIMMPRVLVAASFSFSAFFVPMVVLGQRGAW